MQLSIIIVNYNTYRQLINCLNSIISIISEISYEIIVIDNNSEWNEIKGLNEIFPGIKCIRSDSNYGFAKANNIAVNNAIGKYLLFLNPDTILIDNFIPTFIEYLENNINTAIIAPMLLFENKLYQSSTGQKMNIFYDIQEAFYLTGFIRSIKGKKYIKHNERVYFVSWVSAACMLITKNEFDKIGGFAESYFLNYEDIDLCTKVIESGKKVAYYPKYKCIHLDHKSFNNNYKLLITSRYKSRLIFNKLHLDIFQRLISWLILFTGLLTKIVFVSLFYSGPEKNSRKKGYLDSLNIFLSEYR